MSDDRHPDELLGVTAVADLLGVTKARVGQLAAKGRLPPPEVDQPRHRLWRAGAIAAWAEAWERENPARAAAVAARQDT